VDPASWGQIKAIANGDMKMPTLARGTGPNMALRNAVLNYDPTYTDARYDTKMNFKTKGDATNLSTLAASLEHLEDAKANQDYLVPLSDKGTKYNQAVKVFTEESGKLIKSGALTQGEYHDLKEGLQSVLPYRRKAALDETVRLLGGKVQSTFQKYKTGAGHDIPVQEFFDANSQARLQRYGLAPAGAFDQPGAAPAAAPQGAWTPQYKEGDVVPSQDGKSHMMLRGNQWVPATQVNGQWQPTQ